MDVMTIVGPVALCIGAIAAVAALYALFTFIKDRRREKREAHAPRHRKQSVVVAELTAPLPAGANSLDQMVSCCGLPESPCLSECQIVA